MLKPILLFVYVSLCFQMSFYSMFRFLVAVKRNIFMLTWQRVQSSFILLHLEFAAMDSVNQSLEGL